MSDPKLPRPVAGEAELSRTPLQITSARRQRREIRHKQISLLTQGEAIEFLMAEIEDLEEKMNITVVTTFLPHIHFTKLEEEVLQLLLIHKNKTLLKEAIYSHLYQLRIGGGPELKIIDVIICKIRAKLKDEEYQIKTIWGRGYALIKIGEELPVEASLNPTLGDKL